MVKIDIDENEIVALQALMKDAKVPVDMGYVLGGLKAKIAQAWQKERKDAAKKQLAKELDVKE